MVEGGVLPAELMRIVALRAGCTVGLAGGIERDSMGNRAATGGACEQCGECNRGFGDAGVSSGMAIPRVRGSDVELTWKCPGCGGETVESTTALGSLAAAAEVEADPLCYRCRKASGLHNPVR